ncbi:MULTISPECIES: SDR family NAD(P)-dependent oxidoreductase [unclassified Pedobacter]|uniref:SDR family NAD(P)-dependent oxidoreductase n=1 Tax=unclassified Pedobacter TaxID=2628915 RepID=UPI001DE74981|nr:MULTISPECIES: SDR family NAD(P)-dependent oxidoreductase [unclassified Pedobacter]CAH0157223.1 putative oxidoreductase SA2266 [Pedobacter sp. Bi36]CAH0213636.1 putative oxidoreductase SA2266 [Pedobacter sp. Bi126]
MGNHIVFIIGVLCSARLFYSLIRFIYPYVRGSTLKKYLKNDAFALVTGSSDGIGKAIAIALAEKGFNIVLHGRDAAKLHGVEKEIVAANSRCKVVCLVYDGMKESPMDIGQIKHLPINILVNNVGIGPIGRFGEFKAEEIHRTITLNTSFPSQLTRNLLPQLSISKSLILNVSSYAGLFPPPYLAVYAATKAYNNAFSISLSRELQNTEVISLITGSVNSGSNMKLITFLRPSAATYARHVLSIVGCGRNSIEPYWPHAIQTFLMSLLPEKIINNITRKAIQEELDRI